jgi:hypothetical protein
MLFLSTSGDLTATEPAATSYSQYVATVGEASTTGQMFVSPQKSINFNEAISGASVITDLQNNMKKVTLTVSAATDSLHSASQEILSGASGRIIHIHSAVVTITNPPSSGAQTVDFTIMAGVSSGVAYAAGNAIWHTNNLQSSVANTAGADAMYVMTPKTPDPVEAHLSAGDGIYLSNADGGGTYTDWTSATAKVTVFYSQYTP